MVDDYSSSLPRSRSLAFHSWTSSDTCATQTLGLARTRAGVTRERLRRPATSRDALWFRLIACSLVGAPACERRGHDARVQHRTSRLRILRRSPARCRTEELIMGEGTTPAPRAGEDLCLTTPRPTSPATRRIPVVLFASPSTTAPHPDLVVRPRAIRSCQMSPMMHPSHTARRHTRSGYVL